MSNNTFKFCPRCGAVTQNDICDNCGYDMSLDDDNISEYQAEYIDVEEKGNISDKKKKNYWWVFPIIVCVVVIAFLIVVIAFIVGFLVVPGLVKYNTVASTANSATSQTNLSPSPSPQWTVPDVIDEDNENDDEEEDNNNYQEEYCEYIVPSGYNVCDYDYDDMLNYLAQANEWNDIVSTPEEDYFYGDYYVMSSGKEHVQMTADDFDKPYFNDLADMYDDSYDYDVERRFVRVEGNYDGLYCNLYGAYYVIKSDTEDFSEVNKESEKRVYQNLYAMISDIPDNLTSNSYSVYADSYILYNNDEILSVVYDCYSYLGSEVYNCYFSSINVDMKNACIFDNNELLDSDDEFVEYFVERSNVQNSFVYAINNCSTQKVREVFEDPSGIILFFTPVGMEAGVNYRYGYNSGYVTVTISDFGDYISDDFSFDTDFASQFDQEKYEKENGIGFYTFEVYVPDESGEEESDDSEETN